jgi:hypothetical protein
VRGDLGREHGARLRGPADDRERLLLGDGDGVRLGRFQVGAGAGAGVGLDHDLPPVTLEQVVVEGGEVVDGLDGRLDVDLGAGRRHRGGDQRVALRVGDILDDLDLVGRDALVGLAAVVAGERLDARGCVDRHQLDAAGVGVAGGAPVDVLPGGLSLLPGHRARLDELVRAAGVGGGIVIVVATAAAEDRHRGGDQHDDQDDRPVALGRLQPCRLLLGGWLCPPFTLRCCLVGGGHRRLLSVGLPAADRQPAVVAPDLVMAASSVPR